MTHTRPDLAPAFAALDAFVAQRMDADGTPGVARALTDRARAPTSRIDLADRYLR